jgi:hypothetical protein
MHIDGASIQKFKTVDVSPCNLAPCRPCTLCNDASEAIKKENKIKSHISIANPCCEAVTGGTGLNKKSLKISVIKFL